LTDEALSYAFTCPKCAGSFSIELEKIPPVQARFRCPNCAKPMDFPSRDEARIYASLQVKAKARNPDSRPTQHPAEADAAPADDAAGAGGPGEGTRFRIEKPGYERDVFDRRSLRNLIRAGEVTENDFLRVDDGNPIHAVDAPYLKSLFHLRRSSRVTPPPCCRTHTDQVAFFQCTDTSRPLCEECAPLRKFGGTTIRVCQHCGGTARDLPTP
jgi:predicted Zn finger-like uncharacterized protein